MKKAASGPQALTTPTAWKRSTTITFVVHYNTVYPGYLTQFGGEQIAIWPEHYCDHDQDFVSWDCGRDPLSSGPFVLKEWVEGDHLTLERNPNYYQEGKPYIDEVIIQIVPEQPVRNTMMLEGDADLNFWLDETDDGGHQGRTQREPGVQPVRPLGDAPDSQSGAKGVRWTQNPNRTRFSRTPRFDTLCVWPSMLTRW